MVYKNYEIFMFFYRLPTKERVVPQNCILRHLHFFAGIYLDFAPTAFRLSVISAARRAASASASGEA